MMLGGVVHIIALFVNMFAYARLYTLLITMQPIIFAIYICNHDF